MLIASLSPIATTLADTSVTAADYSIIEDKAKLPILTHSLAERQTLKLRLPNGLEALIVSDPKVDKSSAAMAVKIGSWDEPKEYPGTAHFLEHLLFLGTKKYPNESEYDKFLAAHGGMTNAFTTNNYTSYIFAVNTDAFPEALDRFASFFTEPLFNPSGVSRELQAIDQEYAKNIEKDNVREYYVHKALTNADHPNHGFSMGNSASLSKVSQETLKQWYNSHYSADRMRLIVTSSLPLDKLKQLVVEDFKGVPKHDLQLAPTPGFLLPNTLKQHIVYIEPVTNIRKMSLIWELPLKFADMRDTKPEQLVCQVLGHEGSESLLTELKRLKLAEGIRCGGIKIGGKNMEFYLEIDMTDGGIKNYETVALHVFEAIANFRKKGVPQYLFDEAKKSATISYQYQNREDAFQQAMKHASWIAEEDMDTYPEQTIIIQRFDAQAAEELLNYLTPENVIIDLMAPSSLTGVKSTEKEPWLGVPYSVKPIPAAVLAEWKNAQPNPKIDLPASNPFIPTNLSVISQKAIEHDKNNLLPHPKLIVDSPLAKIYAGQDDRYLSPEVSWIFEIKTPSITLNNAETVVLGDLYIKSALEILSDFTYPASLAGLNFSIDRTDNGISIVIDGYSDKASLLFIDIVEALKNLHPNEQKFKVHRDSLMRQYQNSALENPLAQGFEILKSILYKDFVTDKAKAAVLKKITFQDLEAFTKNLFSSTYTEGMMYGNMMESQATELAKQLLTTLNSTPYPVDKQLKKEIVVLPADKGPFIIESKAKTQGNVAILAIESLPFTFQSKAAQQILMQAMRNPFFSTLRTKQQTGYIVFSQGEEVELHLFDIFAVQSNTHDGRDLIARYELFLEGFLQEIGKTELSEQEFETIKASLLEILTQPPKNIGEMAATLNKIAFKYDADFDWLDKRVEGFKTLSYPKFVELTTQTLEKKNKRRIAIMLKGMIPETSSLQYQKLNNIDQIRKLSHYESKQPIEK